MRNVLDFLINTAARFPEKTAFADEKQTFTFGQLLSCSQSLGTAIADRTQTVNQPIGVLVSRSAKIPAAFMAVLQSGNCYVPLDAQMPQARLTAILEQLSPQMILYGEEDAKLAEILSAQHAMLPMEAHFSDAPDTALLESRRAKVLDTDPVYIIFTSGSTGMPKGIACHHRGVIDLADWLASAGGFSPDDVLGNQAPFYFDGSVKDLMMCLKCGMSCYILPKKLFMFPKLLVGYLNERNVSVLQWATSAFHLVAQSGILEKDRPQYVRKILLGGEALLARDVNLWKKALPEAEIFNLYGPTEATVDALFYKLDRTFSDSDAVPIGKPCANKDVFLLNDDLTPTKQGEVGELCIRGTGLALGYYADAEKTKKAFIQNPLQTAYPERIYRTGDLAVQGEDGLYYFRARQDGQIKHMGYRIELGEIERALAGFEKIREAMCLFDEKKDAIVCIFAGDAAPAEILTHLKTLVPKYMFPNVFVQKDALWHNANGKIDRPKHKKDYFDGEGTGL